MQQIAQLTTLGDAPASQFGTNTAFLLTALKARSSALLWAVALLPNCIAFCFSLVAILRNNGRGNLPDFLGASQAMRHGIDIYNSGTGGYVYPPLIAFLYQPLTMMHDRPAAVVSLVINAGLSIFTLVIASQLLVHRLLGSRDARLIASVAVFGAWFTFDKIKGEFAHIETNVLMLVAFTVALRWLDSLPSICGLALGFAFNIKYMPLAILPYLLLRRRFRAAAWSCVWAIIFALLPAVSMGWKANLNAWAQACGGMLRLIGVHNTVLRPANVRLITDPVSISLTSGMARSTGLASPWPILISASVAALACLTALWFYRRASLPILKWPPAQFQRISPWAGQVAVEWVGIIVLILVFSPFTNSRHLYMLLDANLAAGALVLGTRSWALRAPLLLATIAMAAGISLPPGGVRAFETAGNVWRGIGGPAWSMLGMFTLLIWAFSRYRMGIAERLAQAVSAPGRANISATPPRKLVAV